MLITPTQSNIQAALRAFLLSVLPDGVEVVSGQGNRVPEPQGGSFVVMTPIRFKRLSTNFDTYADVVFEGSVAGAAMTVTTILHGTIIVGRELFGVGVESGTIIDSQTSGSVGGTGVYAVSKIQTI